MSERRNSLLRIMLLTVLASVCSAPAAQVQGQEQRIIDGQLFRDPTQPAGARRSLLQTPAGIVRREYTVSFIRSGGERPMAVVNNTAVTAGDEIDGATVLRINAGTVVLRIDGEDMEISTQSNPALRSAPATDDGQ